MGAGPLNCENLDPPLSVIGEVRGRLGRCCQIRDIFFFIPRQLMPRSLVPRSLDGSPGIGEFILISNEKLSGADLTGARDMGIHLKLQ